MKKPARAKPPRAATPRAVAEAPQAPDGPALLRAALADCRPAGEFPPPPFAGLGVATSCYGEHGLWIGQDGLSALREVVRVTFASDSTLRRLCADDTGLFAAMAVVDGIAGARGGHDDAANWKAFSKLFRAKVLADASEKRTFAYPVWLFRSDVVAAFGVGPVTFMHREEWLRRVAGESAEAAGLAPFVEGWWKSPYLYDNRCFESEAEREAAREGLAMDLFSMGRETGWVADVSIAGFEGREAARRADLAVRCALDAFRLAVPAPDHARIGLAVDIGGSEFRRFEIAREGLMRRRSAGGSFGLDRERGFDAQGLVESTRALRDAAGRRLEIHLRRSRGKGGCPKLSERWLYALHRFGRACLEPLDYAAVEEFAFALDGLGGAGNKAGIVALAGALLGMGPNDPITTDGQSLDSVVAEFYGSRNKTTHGKKMGLDLRLREVRFVARRLCALVLRRYVVALDAYAARNEVDGVNAFLNHLKANPPSFA